MNRKIITFLLCGTLLLSAASCGASGKQANADLSKPVEETAEEVDAAVMDEAGDKLQEVEDSLSDASAEVEETLPEAAEEIIEESESEASASDDAESEANASDDAASGSEDYDASYAFANAKFDGDKIIVVPNGEVNDSTFIYEDKTLGGLCDYIDSTTLTRLFLKKEERSTETSSMTLYLWKSSIRSCIRTMTHSAAPYT